jgi:hypothetical protein
MSEDKSVYDSEHQQEGDLAQLPVDEELSPDEFLEQFTEEEDGSRKSMSEEEFFAAFDRHQSGETPLFVSENTETEELPEEEHAYEEHISGDESEVYQEDSDSSEWYEEEDQPNSDAEYSTHDNEQEEDFLEADEIYSEEDDGLEFEAEEETLESKLNLPKRPRRKGRLLANLLSLITVSVIFSFAGMLGLYMYNPLLVIPYIPQEYQKYLPVMNVPSVEPTLPPGLLESVLEADALEEELITPTPIQTRTPIEVTKVAPPTPIATSVPILPPAQVETPKLEEEVEVLEGRS